MSSELCSEKTGIFQMNDVATKTMNLDLAKPAGNQNKKYYKTYYYYKT